MHSKTYSVFYAFVFFQQPVTVIVIVTNCYECQLLEDGSENFRKISENTYFGLYFW